MSRDFLITFMNGNISDAIGEFSNLPLKDQDSFIRLILNDKKDNDQQFLKQLLLKLI